LGFIGQTRVGFQGKAFMKVLGSSSCTSNSLSGDLGAKSEHIHRECRKFPEFPESK